MVLDDKISATNPPSEQARPDPAAIKLEIRAFYGSYTKEEKHISLAARDILTGMLGNGDKPLKQKRDAEDLLKFVQQSEAKTGMTYERIRAIYITPFLK